MTQTKTVSTRVDDNIYNSLTEYCNQKAKTVSEVMSDILKHALESDMNFHDGSLQCSIESNEETKRKEIPSFSQNERFEKSMNSLDQEKIVQIAKMELNPYLEELKQQISQLGSSFNKKVNDMSTESEFIEHMNTCTNDNCEVHKAQNILANNAYLKGFVLGNKYGKHQRKLSK